MANHKRHSDDGGRGSSRRGGARHNHGSDGVRSHPRKRTPVDPQAAFAALESRLRAQYGDETAAVIVEGYRAERPVTLRANTLKTTPDAVRAALEEAGIACQKVPWSPDALIVEGAREDAVRALPLYGHGDVYLQSLSSMVPPLVLSPGPGDAVLDMAAAPGGKTTQMAALSGGQAQITACERSAPRAERLRFNLERQGAGRVSVLVQDARRLDPFFRFGKIRTRRALQRQRHGLGRARCGRGGGGHAGRRCGRGRQLGRRRMENRLLRRASFELRADAGGPAAQGA